MPMMVDYLWSWLKYYCKCSGKHSCWPKESRTQASLVEEAQDSVSHHNTLSLRASCGGINPYTLTAKLGPIHARGIGPPEHDMWPARKESKLGDQGKILVGWNSNHFPITYGNCNQLGLVSRYISLPPGVYKCRKGTPSKHHSSFKIIQSDIGRMYYSFTTAEPR